MKCCLKCGCKYKYGQDDIFVDLTLKFANPPRETTREVKIFAVPAQI
jgi:hypothetical protein